MTDTNTKVRSLILTALMVVSVFGGSIAFAGSAAAANQVTSPALTNNSVDAGDSQTHQLTFTVTDVEHNGNTDSVYITLPDEYADSISVSSVSADISGSSPDSDDYQSSPVDGPDNDGNLETIEYTFSYDSTSAGASTTDVDFTADFTLDHPSPEADTLYDVGVELQDNSADDASATVSDVITVDGTAAGDATTAQSGGTYFQGQTLSFTDSNVDANEQVEIRNFDRGDNSTGTLVRQTSADATGDVILNTENLETGVYAVEESPDGADENVVLIFEVVQQDLTVTADDGEVVNSGDATIEEHTVETNRAGDTTYTISADGLTTDELADIFGDDADENTDGFQATIPQDATVDADFDGIETGEYTLNFEAVDTTAADSVDVTVQEPAEGTVSLDSTVASEERGDVAQITVNMENADTAYVTIGSDEVNYAATVEVVDGANGDADGTVTLNLNTFLTTEGAAAFSVEDGDDGFTVQDATEFDSNDETNAPLATADYDIVLEDSGNNEVGVGTLVVSERSTDSMQLWTAAALPSDADVEAVYDSISAGDITQDSTIAYQDEVVHQIGVSGVYGALVNEMDASDSDAEAALLELANGDANDPLTLSATQAGNFPNAEPLTVDFGETNTKGGLNVVADSANNTVFVALDTSDVAFDRGDNDDATPSAESLYGQTFDVEFGLLADSTDLVAGDEDEVVTASFSVEERTAEVNGGDDITVEAASGQTISGTTNVAPGTEVNIRARASGSNPFLKTANGVTVGADGTFSGTFDFSDVSENTTFTVTAASTGQAFANAPVEIEGTVGEAAATATPTPEPATDTPTPEPATDTPTPEPATDTPTPEPATDTPTEGGATETETSGSQPGFGGAVAIVALAGAALIALRRNN